MKISSLLLKKAAALGLNLAQIGQILCRPDDDEEAPSLLEKIVDKAQLCANLRLQMLSKVKHSMVKLIASNDQENSGPQQRGKPAPLKRMPKNNSFNEKTNTQVKDAMIASIGDPHDCENCPEDNQEPDSPGFRRNRGLTEGASELQIHKINNNTQGMIKLNIC